MISATSEDRAVRGALHGAAVVRREAGEAARWVGSLKLPEFVLFGLMFVNAIPVPGGHASELFLGLLVVLALFRRPRRELGSLSLLVPLFVIALTSLGLISMFAPFEDGASDWRMRLLRIAAVTALVFVAASGRLDLRSGIAGVVAVCLVNVPLFYAGLVSDDYGGYLTGVFGDKNFAGVVYATFGILAMTLVRRAPYRVALYLVFAGPLWLTGSRTAVAAYALAGIWVLLGPRLHVLGKAVLGALTVWAVEITSEDYSRIGVFSDRLGSDRLRARIDEASRLKVEESGFFGRGLGNAFVTINDRPWFFHNSYWSALVEGGWPWAVFVVGVTVLVLLRPLHRSVSFAQSAALGAGIVLLVTASRLGEVFYTLPWGIALAFGLSAIIRGRPRPEEEPVGGPDPAPTTGMTGRAMPRADG